jgi:predicted nucleic acid-binding protein
VNSNTSVDLIDSCGWLEYFTDGPNVDFFSAPILAQSKIIVPTIVIYELWKKIVREQGEEIAIEITAQLKRFDIVPLDESLSISAAKISLEHKLPMADSIIYATAQKHKAVLWTQDADFKDFTDVKYIEKTRSGEDE